MRIPNWHKKLWGDVSTEEDTMMVFWWGWCSSCEAPYLECPYCGNTSCNAGHGRVDGKACSICWLSDQYEELAMMQGKFPRTESEVDYYNNKILEGLGVNREGELLTRLGKE